MSSRIHGELLQVEPNPDAAAGSIECSVPYQYHGCLRVPGGGVGVEAQIDASSGRHSAPDQIVADDGSSEAIAPLIDKKSQPPVPSSESCVHENPAGIQGNLVEQRGAVIPLQGPGPLLRHLIRMLDAQGEGVRVLRPIHAPAGTVAKHRHKKRSASQHEKIPPVDVPADRFPRISREGRPVRQNEQVAFRQ